MHLDDEVTSRGIIAPRFIDEIADEVDIIEDKKAPPFRKNIHLFKLEFNFYRTFASVDVLRWCNGFSDLCMICDSEN